MLWYEPYASPADWAIKHSSNIDDLVNNWCNCKFNPSVLKPFVCDDQFNFNKFGKLLKLYEDSGATPCQFKDLFYLGFDKLKDFVNSNIEWKFSKLSEDKKKIIDMDPEVVDILLQLSFIFNAEPSQIFISNYPDVNDYMKNVSKNAIVSLYNRECKMLGDGTCTVDSEYAANIIKEIITIINKNTTRDNIVYDFEGSPFVYFVSKLLKQPGYYEAMVEEMILDTVDEYCKRTNCELVSNIFPKCAPSSINDIYDTINCAANKQEASDMLISLLADKSLAPMSAICKISKLCINNTNHFHGNCISKSCEESMIEGIKTFKNPIEDIGSFDIDECITVLEAITYGIDIATEANNYDEEYQDEPEEETESNNNQNKPAPNDMSNNRDFDSDFNKYKKNAKNVDVSLTKILSTLKGFLTGTSADRGTRKATGLDSVAQILARVFGTIAIFHVSKFLGILFIVVRLANSNKVTNRERSKIMSEIKTEIEVLESKLNDGSIESAEAKQNLIRTKRNLEDALSKIERHRPKSMSEGSKQAVRDIIDNRR